MNTHQLTLAFDAPDVGQTMFTKVGQPNPTNYLKLYQRALVLHTADYLGLTEATLPSILGMHLGPQSTITLGFPSKAALNQFTKKHKV